MQGGGDDDLPDLVETRLLRRDGEVVFVEVSPTQTVSFGGQPARLVVARDVTERMRLRQQLLTADRMASIGMLAAGVAHEVNNPLAYVLNNIEFATKELARQGESTRMTRDALAIALEGVDRIRTIVRGLLELSRVDDAAVGPVDVRAVVESTVGLARPPDRRARTARDHYLPVPFARGTAARIGQVLLTCSRTRSRHCRPARRTPTDSAVSVRPSAAGGVVVEISDNGVGIAPEHAARIFDPFFTTKSGRRHRARPRDHSAPRRRARRRALVRVDPQSRNDVLADPPARGRTGARAVDGSTEGPSSALSRVPSSYGVRRSR